MLNYYHADFFIDPHAEIMGWKVATRDQFAFRHIFRPSSF